MLYLASQSPRRRQLLGELGVEFRQLDIEIDEVFVVLTGEATVEFIEPALPGIELRPGSLVSLTSGMRTIWTVRETLRKIYVI